MHDQFLRTVEFAFYGAPFSCSCFKYFGDEFVNVGIVWDWGLVFYCKFVMRPGYNKSEAVVSILYSILALIMCCFLLYSIADCTSYICFLDVALDKQDIYKFC